MWKGKVIEEVSEFKYLGYVLKKRGRDKLESWKRRVIVIDRRNIVTRKVWGLGERIFKDDFRRRMMLFRYLI